LNFLLLYEDAHCFYSEAGEARLVTAVSLPFNRKNLSFCSEFFDSTDANKDGIITMEEWLDSPVRSTSGVEACSILVKQWAKFDPANVGYLTKQQAINRKA
jgi:hypothetical protein